MCLVVIVYSMVFLPLQGSSKHLQATGCSCWSWVTWHSRWSSPCPLWRTSPASGCSSWRHLRCCRDSLVSNWVSFLDSLRWRRRWRRRRRSVKHVNLTKPPPSLDKVAATSGALDGLITRWQSEPQSEQMILSVLVSRSTTPSYLHLFCFDFLRLHRQELLFDAERPRSRGHLSSHERGRPDGSGAFKLSRNPLEPSGERLQGQGHHSAQQHGVCYVGITWASLFFMSIIFHIIGPCNGIYIFSIFCKYCIHWLEGFYLGNNFDKSPWHLAN